ncbi:Uncharacterised protein [Streptococcus pneumoniae]|nr:Uncharacterised protein [Streptococcus pneumoniae]CJD61938.1 Uncharacterised protein [Streptococcus pneumoniae]VMR38264.1 Uncharacterised protein [Streptococcus pneumoniae]VTD90311.1 Uncharacterised protein [Streptococcus pneumoniae]
MTRYIQYWSRVMGGMLSGISNTGVKPNMSRDTKFATMLAARVETQKKREKW